MYSQTVTGSSVIVVVVGVVSVIGDVIDGIGVGIGNGVGCWHSCGIHGKKIPEIF